MAFSLEKFLSDMMGNTGNTKKTNKKNAKTRIVKKKDAPSQNMQDGGRAALKRSQRADRIAAAAKKEKADIDKAYSRSAITSRAKKEKADIDKAYNRSSALSIIKKDTNLVGNKKASNKKVIVTKAQLEKSGLSLRDYMNMLKSKETGRTITRDSRFDKKKKSPSTSNMKNTFSNDVGKSTKVKKKPSKMNPNKANEFASLKKMTNTVKKNKDGKMVIKKNKQGKYVIKKGY